MAVFSEGTNVGCSVGFYEYWGGSEEKLWIRTEEPYRGHRGNKVSCLFEQ